MGGRGSYSIVFVYDSKRYNCVCNDNMLSESLSGAACNQGRLCFLGLFRFSLGFFSEAERWDRIRDKECNWDIFPMEWFVAWNLWSAQLSALNLPPLWPRTGGKLTELTIPERSLGFSTQREGVAICGNLFFHTENDCCSLEGTCKPVEWEIKSSQWKRYRKRSTGQKRGRYKISLHKEKNTHITACKSI